jgi:hypothetical protein
VQRIAVETTLRDLPGHAARCERDVKLWEPRFRELMDSGLLRAVTWPGAELTLRVQPDRNERTAGRSLLKRLEQLLPGLPDGCQIGLDFSAVEAADFAVWLQEFIAALILLHDRNRQRQCQWLFSLQDAHPGLHELLSVRSRQELGFPRIAVRVTTEGLRQKDDTCRSLLELSHRDARVHLVPAGALRPLSSLHAAERGQCVMPASLFEVRAGSAWIVLELDATRLTELATLRTRLRWCLRLADNLIDLQQWPDPRLRLDALLNRRIAIHVVRIGQMLSMQGLSPGRFSSLQKLERWLACMRKCFIRESHQLAADRGPFPAFGAQELVAHLAPHYGVADASRLVRNRSMRHRHLLALSPFSVFPDPAADTFGDDWINLVPAISCADALSMYGADIRSQLRLSTWARLVQMTVALAGASANY